MPDPAPTRAIFINYRRDDTGGEAGRLYDDLTRAFDPNTVFMDVSGIEPGKDFRTSIDENVAQCGVLLAVIGRQWLTIPDSAGTRRLDSPNDFVRLEIASALARDIPVIPVLVQSAAMPTAQALPETLQDLAYRNAVELTLPRWNSDVALLVDALKKYIHVNHATVAEPVHATIPIKLPAPEPPALKPTDKPRLPLILAAVLIPLATAIPLAVHFAHHAKPQPFYSKSDPLTGPQPVPRATAQYQVSLPYNLTGIADDGKPFAPPAGLDRAGHAFHTFNELSQPDTQTMTLPNGTSFNIGAPNSKDVLRAFPDPVTLLLPNKAFSTLSILAVAVNGSAVDQQFAITYADSDTDTQVFTQSFSDWALVDNPRFLGERQAVIQTYRNMSNGDRQSGLFALWEYDIKLNPTKPLKSLALPQNEQLIIFAITLLP